jgi:hypothetical protein
LAENELVTMRLAKIAGVEIPACGLLAGPDGTVRLSPAYDLLCTRLVIPGDQFA